MAYTTIDDPSAHFQTTIYTGNDTDGTQITNSGNSDLKPDWLWIKNRTDAGSAPATGGIWDSTRGFAQDKVLTSFTANAEGANSNGFAVATTDGFTVEDGTSGSNPRTATNKNAKNYVAWQWKAIGGTTSTNTSGGITSTVQNNQTNGFSIVTYTGTGNANTIGHGLTQPLDMIIVKRRDNAQDWAVFTKAVENTKSIFLNLSDAPHTGSGWWNDTNPTSSVFTVGTYNHVNNSGEDYVAYCFHSVKGYSKFGTYEANNNTNGTFVYTGFQPAWVMVKSVDATGNWFIMDSTRSDINVSNEIIFADLNAAEDTSNAIDFLSNGFKLRNSGSGGLNHQNTYFFMAFAKHPFVSSKGVPATAF